LRLTTYRNREILSNFIQACLEERNRTAFVFSKLDENKNSLVGQLPTSASHLSFPPMEIAVSVFRKKPSNDLVPIHPDNSGSNDWAILLEAGTIVGPSQQRVRVARWMQDKKIVKKHGMFLRTQYFIVIEGYNPRIHALYFCPQLFRQDAEKLVPLDGEQIGQLIARAVEGSAAERRPWYGPMDELPHEPLINRDILGEFDTLVVELPSKREALPAVSQPLLGRSPNEQPEAQAEADASDAEASAAETRPDKAGLALEGSDTAVGRRRRSKIPNGMAMRSDL
jgi:hypothetical protein